MNATHTLVHHCCAIGTYDGLAVLWMDAWSGSADTGHGTVIRSDTVVAPLRGLDLEFELYGDDEDQSGAFAAHMYM